jgi:hypothetical protein
MDGWRRRLDLGGTDSAAQFGQVEKAGGSDVGSDDWARAAYGSAEDPAQYRRGQDCRDESTDRHPARARPKARSRDSRSGRRSGRQGCRQHGIQRIGLAAPERLSAGRNRIPLRRADCAVSERNQLFARTEPVAREWHYVVGGPRLFAAVLGFRAFRLHPVAAPLYRVCRSFPPNRDGVRPPGPVVYPSELVPVRLN